MNYNKVWYVRQNPEGQILKKTKGQKIDRKAEQNKNPDVLQIK